RLAVVERDPPAEPDHQHQKAPKQGNGLALIGGNLGVHDFESLGSRHIVVILEPETKERGQNRAPTLAYNLMPAALITSPPCTLPPGRWRHTHRPPSRDTSRRTGLAQSRAQVQRIRPPPPDRPGKSSRSA